jgi:hypothetical protein
MFRIITEGRYEVTSFALDERGKSVSACGVVFMGTHTGQGGNVLDMGLWSDGRPRVSWLQITAKLTGAGPSETGASCR